MSIILPSSQLPLHFKALIYGPPKSGKTFYSATASSKFTSFQTKTDLDDLLWILFDRDGLYGFKEVEFSTPVLDFSDWEGDIKEHIQNFQTKYLATIRERIKHGQTNTIIVDTISSLDMMIRAQHEPKGLNAWPLISDLHRQFFLLLHRLPCNVITLAHSKIVLPPITEDDKARLALRQSMLALPGFSEVTFDISGKALDLYRRNLPFIWSFECQRSGKNEAKRFLRYDNLGAKREVGSRLSKVFEKFDSAKNGTLNVPLYQLITEINRPKH